MPTSINYPPDAKGKWSLPILIALIALAAISFLVHVRPSKARLLADLTSRLRAEEFEQLYDEAGDNVHLNVTKEKFVRRMKIAVAKLKAIDPGLNFQHDASREGLFENRDESILITAARKLEGNGKSVSVLLYWNSKGEFFNISAIPQAETPEEFNVYGVSYHSLRVGGQLVDE
jgi:hypothetical protein